MGFKWLLTCSTWHRWFICKKGPWGVRIINITLHSVPYKYLQWPDFLHCLRSTQAVLDVNKLMKTDDSHTNVSSQFIFAEREVSPYVCFYSSWAWWTSAPHGQGNTEESAQWEFREVNKWVWNVSGSHAASLDTQALRKHVSGYRMANWDSVRPAPTLYAKGQPVWGGWFNHSGEQHNSGGGGTQTLYLNKSTNSAM